MLIDLVKPSMIHNEMKLAGECIVDLIDFCYTTGVTNGQFNKDQFLRKHRYRKYKDCCLMKHPGAMRNRMKTLFDGIPASLIPTIITYLKTDLNYVRGHSDGMFRFSGYMDTLVLPGLITPDERKQVIEIISDVFGNLYDDFFGHQESTSPNNNRDRFKEEYRKLNARKEHICPACLGQLYLGKAQLDHYFPKSLFPALVIQPFNLVPICMECNSSVGKKHNKGKGNRVPSWPWNGHPVNQPGCLTNVYVPYIRSAEKKISAEVVGNPGSRVIKIRALSTAEPIENDRIKRFVATFNLEKVWTERIPFHYNILMQRVLTEFAPMYAERLTVDQTVTKEELADFLWYRLVLTADEEAVYEVGYQFEFICYVISIATMPASFHAFYKELIKRLKMKRKSTVKIPHFYDRYIEQV